jgi:lipopolysaccharide export system protein LptA
VRSWKINLLRNIGILILTAIAVSILCFTVWAASEKTKTVIYDYSADETSVNRKTGITVLKGNAKIKTRDSEDYLNADQITIYRDIETNELIKMESVGNVDMNQAGMKATCEQAILYEAEDRIELEGSEDSLAVVDDGNNRMEAPAITLFRKEDRIEARGKVTGYVTIEAKEDEAVEPTEEKAEKKGA